MSALVSERTSDDEVARTAGRGGLAVAFAKMFFIVVGLIQTVALKAVLGLDAFGALSSALAAASIVYNPVIQTSVQGVSRAVAQSQATDEPATIRRTIRVHAAFAVPLGATFFLVSGPLCWFLGMPHVRVTMQILSAVVTAYGLYAPLIGVLNGRKNFVGQAAFDVVFAVLRTGGLLTLGWAGMRLWHRGPEGSALGFSIAAVVICVAAMALVGLGKPGNASVSVREYLQFIGPLALGQLLLNLLFQADSLMLRGFAAHAASAAGLPLEAADPLVGAYRATQLFCFLPYQLLLSVTFVIFPLLAKAHHAGEFESVKQYVRTGVRLALVIAGAMVAVNSGLAARLLTMVFGRDTAVLGTHAMQILSVGFGAFAIFGILTTVLNSLHAERAAAKLTLGTFALVAVLGTTLLYGKPFGPELLWWMALSTSVALTVGTIVAAGLVQQMAGAVAAPASIVRVVLAAAVAVAVGRCLPDIGLSGLLDRALSVGYAALVGAVYLLTLVAIRELRRDDIAMIRAVLPRSKRG